MTYEIRLGSLPAGPLFLENGITIIRGYEVVVTVPRHSHQPGFLMSGFSIRNSSEPHLYVVHPNFIIIE